MSDTPEQQARREIDRLLIAAGWLVQDRHQTNITASRGVAIREYPLKPGHGFADYMLYLDGVVGEDSASLPEPDVLAAEIVEDLEAALAEFAQIAADLKVK